MLNTYLKLSGNTKFIIGYEYDKKVYIYFMDTLTNDFVVYDTASKKNGGCKSIRIRLTKSMKKSILNSSIELCAITDLDNDKYNKGEMLENRIYNKYNQVWHKENRCFIEGGDIRIDNVEYQIKFQRATITTEKTLNNIMSRIH
jgi:hypothetical protein